MVIRLDLRLGKKDIEDIVVTALEGGIGYWACLDNTGKEFENVPKDEPVAITAASVLLDGGTLTFFDNENGDEYYLDLGMLMDGIKRFWMDYDSNGIIKNGHIDTYNLDASDADVIFQYAMFDEIVFG